jgi:DNA polymerase elongation subunit (family B)
MTQSYINGVISREDILLYYRDEQGELHTDTYPAEHIAYFKSDEVTTQMRHDWRVNSWSTDIHGWARCVFAPGRYEKERPNKWTGQLGCWVPFREPACKEWGVTSYEADVSPLRRLMSDSQFAIGKPKRAYYDIETDSRCTIEEALEGKARILCCTLRNEAGDVKRRIVLDVETDDDEQRVLTEFWHFVDQFDQLAAWNGDGFDQIVIRARTKILGLEWNRRLLWIDQMEAYKRHNISNSESGDEKQSFALDVVATNVLGYGKHDFDASKTYEAWAAGGAERQRMVDYCAQDTDLLPAIEAATGYLDVVQAVAELCGIFPDSRSLKPTAQVDGYMLRLGAEMGTHFRTKWYDDDNAHVKFPGAYVMHPKTIEGEHWTAQQAAEFRSRIGMKDGLLRNVLCGDFASMYPNNIITWNLSPDAKDLDGNCVSPSNGVRTSERRQGIMPYALKRLLAFRKELKVAGNKRAEKAVKIVANSFYGVLGTPYSRFYDRELCEATTQNGKWLIEITIAEAEKRGWQVCYADTDSLFVIGPTVDEFKAFLAWCNSELYPPLTAAQGVRECTVSIAFDKGYDHIVFTAAKRYVAKSMGSDKAVVKGLEFKRGDTNKIARELQKKIVDMIVAGEFDTSPYEKLVGEYRERVATESLSKEFVIITKAVGDLDEYESNPPQLRIAEILKARGHDIRPGTRVGYVIIDGYASPKKVIPAEDYTGCEVDRDALWNQAVFPASKRLLEAAFPLGPWSRWLRKGKPKVRHVPRQQSLF